MWYLVYFSLFLIADLNSHYYYRVNVNRDLPLRFSMSLHILVLHPKLSLNTFFLFLEAQVLEVSLMRLC